LEFLSEYGIFLAKAVTIVVAILIIIAAGVSAGQRQKKAGHEGHIEVKHLNDKLDKMAEAIQHSTLDKEALKQQEKARKKEEKAAHKQQKKEAKSKAEPAPKKHIYVLEFDGDKHASEVDALREEVTSILAVADEKDEVVIKLTSPGGLAHTYGLAASQLKRITDRNIQLTACVDEVAASGGYMMACVANRILAAPFAILGSIGVVVQMPNVHRLLKKHDIDFELLTAGEYKRTLTVFGENTDKGRAKFVEDLEDVHTLFKEFVKDNRPQVDLAEVATGETWFGTRALDKKLVDELKTSDEFISELCKDAEVYEVTYEFKKSLQDKLGVAVHNSLDKLLLTWLGRLDSMRYFK